MEKKKTERSRKKKCVPNVEKEKEELRSEENNCRTAVQDDQSVTKEILEVTAKQNDNEFNDATKLSNEADLLHSMLTNNYTDNDDQIRLQGIEEAKLHHEEQYSCPSFSNCVAISPDEHDKGNFPHGKKDLVENDWMIEEISQERNVTESNSKSNLIEMYNEAENIKTSEIDRPETETINIEESNNSLNVHDESTSNLAESLIIDDLQATDHDTLKTHNVENIRDTKVSGAQISEILHAETPKLDFLADRNSNNPEEELAEKDGNLDAIGNKTEANVIEKALKQINNVNIQHSKTDIVVNTTKTEASIDFTIGSQDVDTGNSIVTEKTEQSESEEVKEENENTEESGKKEFKTFADMVNLSESCTSVTELLQENVKPLISDEAIKLVEDPVFRNEITSEILASDVIQERSSPEIPKDNNERISNNESVTITWQHDSVKESHQTVKNLPAANEAKITCGIELLKDSEELNSGEVQLKNKFYEAIIGFWKHTGFSKKRSEISMSTEQPTNLSSDLKQMSSFHSSKTSLKSTKSLEAPEISSEFTAKVTIPHSEANVISSVLEDTATDRISGSSRNSLNTTITENINSDAVSETLQVITPDSLSMIDEIIKDSDDSFEKMEDSKKCKKGKTESANLSVFGHRDDIFSNLETFNHFTTP